MDFEALMVGDRIPAAFVELRRRKRGVEHDSVALRASYRFELVEQGGPVALPLAARGYIDAGDVVAAEGSRAEKLIAVLKDKHHIADDVGRNGIEAV